MNRAAAVAVIVGIIIGLLVGYLWWGMGTRQLESELAEAKQTSAATADKLGEAEARVEKLRAQVEGLEGRLKALEEELSAEKGRRTRLEGLLSRGRK